MLTKVQRNEIFQAIQKLGMTPADFTEKVSFEPQRYELRLKEIRGPYFRLEPHAFSAYEASCLPRVDSLGILGPGLTDWGYTLPVIRDWLMSMKSELDAPDLWADLQANARLLGSIQAAPEEVFTPDEARQLRIQLQHVQQQLLTAGLPEAAARQLAQTVQEAGTKAERFTKKEWQDMVIGAIIGQMTALTLTVDNAKVVFHILKTALTGLFLP